MDKKKEFIRGMKSGIPIIISFIPIAMTFSMLALQAGLSNMESGIMSICVLAGASQMMAVSMIGMGAGTFAIVLATFMLNLRHLIMSTYVMNKLKKVPLSFSLILAFGITDETFAIMSAQEDDKANSYFLAGLVLDTYSAWVGGTLLGNLLILVIPQIICDSMSIALYVMFISILVSEVRKEIMGLVIAGISMLINYLLSYAVSSSSALIITIILSSIMGVFILEKKEKKSENRDGSNHIIDGAGDIYTKSTSGSNR